MSDFDRRFVSKRQQWNTPNTLFEPLNSEFGFEVDLAADSRNTKCKKYFTEEENSLEKEWIGTCWLNPPYGDKKHKLVNWVRKSYESSSTEKCTVVMLIPVRTNTKWWHDYCMNSKEVRFICGRPKFGDANYGLPLPLCVVIFSKHSGTTVFSSFKI